MSYNTIRQALEEQFRANWTITSITPDYVRYSNAVFNPPRDEKWVSIDIHWMANKNIAICEGPVVRRRGIVEVEVYNSLDSGTGDLLDMMESIVAIFENKQLSIIGEETRPITTEAAVTKHVGVANRQGADPVWYQYSIRIPFWRDE